MRLDILVMHSDELKLNSRASCQSQCERNSKNSNRTTYSKPREALFSLQVQEQLVIKNRNTGALMNFLLRESLHTGNTYGSGRHTANTQNIHYFQILGFQQPEKKVDQHKADSLLSLVQMLKIRHKTDYLQQHCFQKKCIFQHQKWKENIREKSQCLPRKYT